MRAFLTSMLQHLRHASPHVVRAQSKHRRIRSLCTAVFDQRIDRSINSTMPSAAMTRALLAVRAAVRMKILLRRLGEANSEAGSEPLLLPGRESEEAPTLHEKLVFAKASLLPCDAFDHHMQRTRTRSSGRLSGRPPGVGTPGYSPQQSHGHAEEREPKVNWFANDIFAVWSLMTASYINLLLVRSACMRN